MSTLADRLARLDAERESPDYMLDPLPIRGHALIGGLHFYNLSEEYCDAAIAKEACREGPRIRMADASELPF